MQCVLRRASDMCVMYEQCMRMVRVVGVRAVVRVGEAVIRVVVDDQQVVARRERGRAAAVLVGRRGGGVESGVAVARRMRPLPGRCERLLRVASCMLAAVEDRVTLTVAVVEHLCRPSAVDEAAELVVARGQRGMRRAADFGGKQLVVARPATPPPGMRAANVAIDVALRRQRAE